MLVRSVCRVALGIGLAVALGVFAPVQSAAAIGASQEHATPKAEPAATPTGAALLRIAGVPPDRLSIDGGKSWVALDNVSVENSAPSTIGSSQSRGNVGQKALEAVAPQDASTAALLAALQKNPDVPSLLVFAHGSEYTFKNVVFTKSTESRPAIGLAAARTLMLTFLYQAVTNTVTPVGTTSSPAPSPSASCNADGHGGTGCGGSPVSGHGGSGSSPVAPTPSPTPTPRPIQ